MSRYIYYDSKRAWELPKSCGRFNVPWEFTQVVGQRYHNIVKLMNETVFVLGKNPQYRLLSCMDRASEKVKILGAVVQMLPFNYLMLNARDNNNSKTVNEDL